MTKEVKVLALTKYGDQAASTRQRLTQYLPALEALGYSFDLAPLFDNDHLQRLNDRKPHGKLTVGRAYLRRLASILFSRKYDLIWLHCEAFPYLPSAFERLVFLYGRPVILDFDDAIFHQYDSHRSSIVRRFLGRKLQPLMKRVAACACGNAYLEDYAKQFNSNTFVLPTVVDTDSCKPANPTRPGNRKPVVGWIGSPSTWRYLSSLTPSLVQLLTENQIEVRIVGAGRVDDPPNGFEMVDWVLENEVSDIQSFDIGIMPLPNEKWAQGKCGYKLIQYMACGLPVVASPVGVNERIVIEGQTGFLASSVDEFLRKTRELINQPSLRQVMGQKGRVRALDEYSLKRYTALFASILKDVS